MVIVENGSIRREMFGILVIGAAVVLQRRCVSPSRETMGGLHTEALKSQWQSRELLTARKDVNAEAGPLTPPADLRPLFRAILACCNAVRSQKMQNHRSTGFTNVVGQARGLTRL